LPDEPGPHHRRRHVGDPPNDRRDARPRAADRALSEDDPVDFRLTDGQQLLQSAARDFLARHCPIEVAPGAEPRRDDREALWSRMAGLGWPGLLVPADLGGSDGTLLDAMLLDEEIGRFGAESPYAASAVVATSLLLSAGSAAHRRIVAEMAQGRR